MDKLDLLSNARYIIRIYYRISLPKPEDSPYHTTISIFKHSFRYNFGLLGPTPTTGGFAQLNLAQRPHYTINPRLDQRGLPELQSSYIHQPSTIQNTILQMIVHNHTLNEGLVFPLTIKTCFNLLPTSVISK